MRGWLGERAGTSERERFGTGNVLQLHERPRCPRNPVDGNAPNSPLPTWPWTSSWSGHDSIGAVSSCRRRSTDGSDAMIVETLLGEFMVNRKSAG